MSEPDKRLGALYEGDGRCRFVVWAPKARQVDVHLYAPKEQVVTLESRRHGYFEGTVSGVQAGSTYKYRLDGGDGSAGMVAGRLFRSVSCRAKTLCTRFSYTSLNWQDCVHANGAYVKDLSVVDPDLSRVCLVDNSPVSYAINQGALLR